MTEGKVSTGMGNRWVIKGQELCTDSPIIMGILNVTPDSFSDGGKYSEIDGAISRAKEMLSQGATIIDIGGESTRPGSIPVNSIEEISRVVPVIESLVDQSDAIISIDTQKADVASAGIIAGAHIVNDVSAGLNDSDMLNVIASSDAGYVMMHMQGRPENMQDAPTYEDVIAEVKSFLSSRLQDALDMNIDVERIVLDPGIGFGKTLENNLDLLGKLSAFDSLQRPILVGASRKSFIGMVDGSELDQRLGGSLAAVVSAYMQGVRLFRVHDVLETRQVLDIFTAIQKHSD